MKNRALSIFLLSILVISCFLYASPLISLAYVSFDNYIAWSLTSGSSSTSIIESQSDVYVNSFTYSDQTGWTSMTYPYSYDMKTQLPSHFA